MRYTSVVTASCFFPKLAALAALVAFAGGCRTSGTVKSAGEFEKLVNGKIIEEDEYPAVFWIGHCTGTFVSDNAFLTARHCVDPVNSDGEGAIVTLKRRINVKALKVIATPEVRSFDASDLAVAIFPDNTAPAIASMYRKKPKTGDRAVMVGYGQSFDGDDAGTKRKGTSTITAVDDGVIESTRTSRQRDSGIDVSVGPGDSGGPIFINGAIAGVTSWMMEYSASGHVDLSSAASLATMKLAVMAGARIPLVQDPAGPDVSVTDDSIASATNLELIELQKQMRSVYFNLQPVGINPGDPGNSGGRTFTLEASTARETEKFYLCEGSADSTCKEIKDGKVTGSRKIYRISSAFKPESSKVYRCVAKDISGAVLAERKARFSAP